MGLAHFISILFFISISSTCHCHRLTSFARRSTTHSNAATNGPDGVHNFDGGASYYRAGQEPDWTYGSAMGAANQLLTAATRDSFDALSDDNPMQATGGLFNTEHDPSFSFDTRGSFDALSDANPMQTTSGLFNTEHVPSFSFDALRNDEYYKYPTEEAGGRPLNFNVVDFGATGNGQANDAQAFLKAWQATCSSSNPNPTLVVPRGQTFLVTPITFSGPCKSPVLVQIYGNLVAPKSSNGWGNADRNSWIVFSNIIGLTVDGGKTGQINGNGEAWWKYCNTQDCVRPVGLRLHGCHNFLLQQTSHFNSSKGHIAINSCSNGTISGINVVAPEDSPNTDGLDISYSNQITIQQSSIRTGDDCVAINGGSSFITVNNTICGPGHGISIGSLGGNGKFETAEAITVQNCNFSRTQNGARIKTWQGGSGNAYNITFTNIRLDAVKNPIIIDQFYCGGNGHSCPSQTSSVKISDVHFTNIQGTTTLTKHAIQLNCSMTGLGCTNIFLDNIRITPLPPLTSVDAICTNAHGLAYNVMPSVSNCRFRS